MLTVTKKLDPRIQKWAPYGVMALAILAAYSNIYENKFLLDDEFLIVQNAFIRSWDLLGRIFASSSTAGSGGVDLFYRPLQIFVYLIVYQFAGLSLFAFHVPNVLLHIANACMIYALGRRLNFAPAPTFAAALLWALHPLHVEAIAYMSSTADPLYAALTLLTLHWLLPTFEKERFMPACALFALALMSKETAVSLPLLVMATQFLAAPARLDPRTYLRTWPLWATLIAYATLRQTELNFTGNYHFHAQPNPYTEHVYIRILTFLATLPHYAALLVWPGTLHMERDFPIQTEFLNADVLLGAAMVTGALAQLVFSRTKKGLSMSWGILWFFSAHLLHTGVLIPVNALFLEHWMYLPSAGLFLGTAQSLHKFLQEKPYQQRAEQILAGLVLVAALGFGIRSFVQNTVWRDSISFYTHIISNGVRVARDYNNLANAYADTRDYPRAVDAYREGIKIWDVYPQAHHNLALSLLRLPGGVPNNIDEAIRELERAVALDPGFFQSYEMLANIYAYRGDKEKEALYRGKNAEIRRQRGIPDDVYAQPVLAAP